MRTLAIRDDRIGDLVLTLPALAALAAAGAAVTLVASASNVDLVAHDARVASTVVLPARGLARLRAFARLLRRGGFDRVFFFRSRWPLGWIAAALGVPARIGPLANLDALGYTVRPRQRRSRCESNEADYGLELVRLAGAVRADAPRTPALAVPEVLRERARRWLAGSLSDAERARPLVVVHPGSGGSSRNWRALQYRALVRELVRGGRVAVVVSAAPGEEALAHEVAGRPSAETAAARAPRERGAVPVHVGWAGPLAHAALLAEAHVVVSGSTGTMHLGAAMGAATVSLFPPIHASAPKRWGPVAPQARFHVPPVPHCERCIGAKCPWWDCMDRIAVEDVVESVQQALRAAEGARG